MTEGYRIGNDIFILTDATGVQSKHLINMSLVNEVVSDGDKKCRVYRSNEEGYLTLYVPIMDLLLAIASIDRPELKDRELNPRFEWLEEKSFDIAIPDKTVVLGWVLNTVFGRSTIRYDKSTYKYSCFPLSGVRKIDFDLLSDAKKFYESEIINRYRELSRYMGVEPFPSC